MHSKCNRNRFTADGHPEVEVIRRAKRTRVFISKPWEYYGKLQRLARQNYGRAICIVAHPYNHPESVLIDTDLSRDFDVGDQHGEQYEQEVNTTGAINNSVDTVTHLDGDVNSENKGGVFDQNRSEQRYGTGPVGHSEGTKPGEKAPNRDEGGDPATDGPEMGAQGEGILMKICAEFLEIECARTEQAGLPFSFPPPCLGWYRALIENWYRLPLAGRFVAAMNFLKRTRGVEPYSIGEMIRFGQSLTQFGKLPRRLGEKFVRVKMEKLISLHPSIVEEGLEFDPETQRDVQACLTEIINSFISSIKPAFFSSNTHSYKAIDNAVEDEYSESVQSIYDVLRTMGEKNNFVAEDGDFDRTSLVNLMMLQEKEAFYRKINVPLPEPHFFGSKMRDIQELARDLNAVKYASFSTVVGVSWMIVVLMHINECLSIYRWGERVVAKIDTAFCGEIFANFLDGFVRRLKSCKQTLDRTLVDAKEFGLELRFNIDQKKRLLAALKDRKEGRLKLFILALFRASLARAAASCSRKQ